MIWPIYKLFQDSFYQLGCCSSILPSVGSSKKHFFFLILKAFQLNYSQIYLGNMDACNADIYLSANHYLLISIGAEQ